MFRLFRLYGLSGLFRLYGLFGLSRLFCLSGLFGRVGRFRDLARRPSQGPGWNR